MMAPAAAFFEDLEWLIDAGETCRETLAARLGSPNVEAFSRHLLRHGRGDLLARTHTCDMRLREFATTQYGVWGIA